MEYNNYEYVVTVTLFFIFAFLFKFLLNFKKNSTEFTFKVIKNGNYIHSFYNFKNINHINHNQGVIPSFEVINGIETVNTLIVIFEKNITQKYEIIITTLDGNYLFNLNCDQKSYNYCAISIKGSEICKGNGEYKIEIKPIN